MRRTKTLLVSFLMGFLPVALVIPPAFGGNPEAEKTAAPDQDDGAGRAAYRERGITEDYGHYLRSFECLSDDDFEGALRELDAALAIFPGSLLYKVQRQFVEFQMAVSDDGNDSEEFLKRLNDWGNEVELPPAETPEITDPEALEAFLASSPVTVVDFTTAWCVPCQMLSPYLTRIEAAYAPIGVKFVRIDISKFATEENREFFQENGLGPVPDVRVYLNGQPYGRVPGMDPTTILYAIDCAAHAAGGYRARQPSRQEQPNR
ncbi:MAG: thioredoxin family protein [Thermoguttaceae bacterium]|nr:thioredoxin family protein [Thermoguttaceae bacterium]